MITIKNFVGAILGEITRARVVADLGSAHVADQYLNHDILKSFPIPRMNIQDIQLELNFAVSANQNGSGLANTDVQKNIVYKMIDLLHVLPDHPDFTSYFKMEDTIRAKWKTGVDQLSTNFHQILVNSSATPDVVAKSFLVIAENHFYESAPEKQRIGLSKLLDHPLRKHKAEEGDTMRSSLLNQIENQINAAAKTKPIVPDDPMDLSVMIGASELETLNPDRLQKMKITLGASDRKWVTIEKDGKKTFVLEKN